MLARLGCQYISTCQRGLGWQLPAGLSEDKVRLCLLRNWFRFDLTVITCCSSERASLPKENKKKTSPSEVAMSGNPISPEQYFSEALRELWSRRYDRFTRWVICLLSLICERYRCINNTFRTDGKHSSRFLGQIRHGVSHLRTTDYSIYILSQTSTCVRFSTGGP